MPGVITFNVDWNSDLSNSHSNAFLKAKLALEKVLFQAFLYLLAKAPIAVQVISFSYAEFTRTSLFLLLQTKLIN